MKGMREYFHKQDPETRFTLLARMDRSRGMSLSLLPQPPYPQTPRPTLISLERIKIVKDHMKIIPPAFINLTDLQWLVAPWMPEAQTRWNLLQAPAAEALPF